MRRVPLHLFLQFHLAVAALFSSGPVNAEWALGAYGGYAATRDAGVRYVEQHGTRLTFDKISWSDESFTDPPYYGLRLTYWLTKRPDWALALDFTHAKMIGERDAVVPVAGWRGGAPVRTNERLGDTFGQLEFSHGHNLLTVNVLRRGRPGQNLGLVRAQPYVGLGIGLAIPHVEVATSATTTREYQIAGPAAQGLVGISLHLAGRFSVFGEYKLSRAEISADLRGDGSVEVTAVTQHFAVGLSRNF